MLITSADYNPSSAVRSLGMKISIMTAEGVKTFLTEDIISAEIFEGVDMGCERFLSRTFNFEVRDKYGMSKPLTAAKVTGSKVSAEFIINGESLHVGDFFIEKIKTDNLGVIARFQAADIVSRMSRYITGLAISSPISLSELISYDSGAVAGLNFICDSVSGNALVCPTMYTEVDTQKRCLLFLAQAALASQIWVDRLGNVNIKILTYGAGHSITLTSDDILSYSDQSLRSYVDYTEVSGENNKGKYSGVDGSYFSGCNMHSLKNDFLAAGNAAFVAKNYRSAKNLRYELKLRTRCNPAIEIGDRVEVLDRSGSSIGEFCVAAQTFHFSKSGLYADITLASASTAD